MTKRKKKRKIFEREILISNRSRIFAILRNPKQELIPLSPIPLSEWKEEEEDEEEGLLLPLPGHIPCFPLPYQEIFEKKLFPQKKFPRFFNKNHIKRAIFWAGRRKRLLYNNSNNKRKGTDDHCK